MNRLVRPAVWVTAAFLAAAGVVEAQPRRRPPASYVQIGIPDQQEGAKILEQSRNIGLAGRYYLEFDLLIRPRNGAESRVPGRWFGSLNATGPITRIELMPEGAPLQVWLVQSGPRPGIWHAADGAPLALLAAGADRALAGTNLSAIDLQTPFMFWTDFVYEGLERFRGRPTHVFLLFPPEAEAARIPGVGGARVFIDTAYHALLQAQWVDEDGRPLKTIAILNLKQIDERWIVKSFEARDEATRDKTRFVVRGAALDVALPEEMFSPVGTGGRADFDLPRQQVIAVK